MKKDYYHTCFIPKTSQLQPDFYRTLGLNREAVFIDNKDNEFIICLCLGFDSMKFRSVEVLRQHSTHRSLLFESKTIKASIEYLTKLFNK